MRVEGGLDLRLAGITESFLGGKGSGVRSCIGFICSCLGACKPWMDAPTGGGGKLVR